MSTMAGPDEVKAAQLRWLAARSTSLVARAGYLALAAAIEKSAQGAKPPENPGARGA
jgi:hypothetical protein